MDILQNVLLFMPLGAGLALLRRSRLEAAGISVVLSIAVELLQYFVIFGRDAAARDVLSNLAGGVAGHWVVAAGPLLVRPSRKRARTLVHIGATAWLGVTCLTSWTMRRAPSDTPAFLVSERPVCCHGHQRFRGTVLEVSVAGQRLTAPAVVRDTLALARLSLNEPLAGRVALIPGPPAKRTTLVVGVYDDRLRAQWVLVQEDRAARFAIRLRADAILFRSPITELRDALPDRPGGSTVLLESAYDRGRVTLSATRDGARRSTVIALGPGLGWSLLSPIEVPAGGVSVVLNVLWLLGLTLPLGYWWGLARGGAVVLGAAFILGLAVLPRLLWVTPASALEWTGVLGGLLLGTVLARQAPGNPPTELAGGGPAS